MKHDQHILASTAVRSVGTLRSSVRVFSAIFVNAKLEDGFRAVAIAVSALGIISGLEMHTFPTDSKAVSLILPAVFNR